MKKTTYNLSLLMLLLPITNFVGAHEKQESKNKILLSNIDRSGIQIKSDTLKINLRAAIDTSIAKYPKIKAALAEKKSVNELVKSSRTAFIPSLKLQEQVMYGTANGLVGTYFSNEGLAIPTSGANRNAQDWNATYGQSSTAMLSGPIFSFGKINAGIKEKEAKLGIAEAEYQNEIFQHKIRVAEAYLYLLVYQKLRNVQAQNLKRANDINRYIKASVSSGLKSGVDSSFSAAEASKARINYLTSIRDEKTWQIKLSELIGMKDVYFVLDSMSFNSALPMINSAQNTIESNPILNIYKSKIKSDEFSARAVKRTYLPTLKYMALATGRGSGVSNKNDLIYTSSFTDGTKWQRYNYLLGAYFVWNVLDIFRVNHDYKSQMYQVQKDNSLLDEARLNLYSQLENSNIQLSLALEQAREAPIQLSAATAGFFQSKARYESGLTNLIELSQTLYILTRAEADYTITYNNTWRALLASAASIGDFNLFLNAVKN